MLIRVVFNQKGGVGKSSITVNLAAIAAKQGLKTLLIDLDPQCNSTQYVLGHTTPVATNIGGFYETVLTSPAKTGFLGSTLEALKKVGQSREGEFADLGHYVQPTPYANLSIVAASPELATMENALQSKHKIFKLKEGLEPLKQKFDLVFIDTPPAFNFFSLSALIAANRVLVPFDGDVFAHRALQQLIENVFETQSDHNPNLLIEGIIVNHFQPRTTLSQQALENLKKEGMPVLKNMLSSSIVMKESHLKSLPLIYGFEQHKLTKAFVDLFKEIQA